VSEENRSITIKNSKLKKAKIAGGDINIFGQAREGTAAGLRAELRRHRDELVGLAGDKGRRVEDRLDEIDEELGKPKPDPETVRVGWKSVAAAITGAGGAAESLTKIAELVRSLFGS
jgi:hypothetical protein